MQRNHANEQMPSQLVFWGLEVNIQSGTLQPLGGQFNLGGDGLTMTLDVGSISLLFCKAAEKYILSVSFKG